MKVLLPLGCVAITLVTILLSSGCQKKTVVTNPDSQPTNGLHDNTKPLQAADLVGYDGKRLSKSLDKIKRDNNKHNKKLENTTEGQ